MEKKGSLMTNVSVDTEDKQGCERLRGGHGAGTRSEARSTGRALPTPAGTAERDQPSGVWPARSDPLTGPAELLAPACPPPPPHRVLSEPGPSQNTAQRTQSCCLQGPFCLQGPLKGLFGVCVN
ncbi:unnamed protein product [Boreogadus saida]